jgi:hypothetical protein
MPKQAASKSPPVATSEETVDALMGKARRRLVPIRRVFVQQGTQRKPEPGPLSVIVRNHDERALDLYLLMRALASHEPYEANQPAPLWARCLALRGPSAAAAISRTWKRLEDDYRLISRKRSGELASITPLMEDGSGDPYAPPTRRDDIYLRVPVDYWTSPQRWYLRLELPAKAMLLIGLSLKPGFPLPYDKAAAWYGISRATAERGLRELRDWNVLRYVDSQKKAPLSPLGYTNERRYWLREPFRLARRESGDSATSEVKRAAATGGE